MKKTLSCGITLALFVLVGASCLQAQSQPANPNRDSMLVTVDWLAAHLGDPSLVLLQIREPRDSEKGHIPGAQYLEYSDVTPLNELSSAEQLVAVFEKLGVSNDSRIVLYRDGSFGPSVTRAFWTLDYLGLGDHTSILDGGLRAWRDAGKPVTSSIKQPARGSIKPVLHPEVVVDAEWVRSHIGQPGVTLIDARDLPSYKGGDMHGGHIPGAMDLPIDDLVDRSTGRLKSPNDLTSLFHAAGLKPGNVMVSYCHVGQMATVLYFAAKLLGYDAKMYRGSMADWGQKDLPVVSGGSPGKP